MSYFVSPGGTPNHTVRLFARSDQEVSEPYMPPGKTIQWRINGTLIPSKEGTTSDLQFLSINSQAGADFNLSVFDSGSLVDFVIDGTVFSNPILISNQAPTLSANVGQDSFGRTSPSPLIQWEYSDADGDPQYSYRISIGTASGLSDIYDSGHVVSTISSLTFPGSPMSRGSTYFWKVEVSDGQKTNPLDPNDPSSPRVQTSVSGSAVVNALPVAGSLTIDGVSSGHISSVSPAISWVYSDADGQPQAKHRVIVARDNSLTSVLWDSGDRTGNQGSVGYNSDGTGAQLESHSTLYLGVAVFDGIEYGNYTKTSFVLASAPVLTLLTVDSKVNPLNVQDQTPTFNWKYTDIDDDSLTAYEIRVSTSSDNLGTDSFIGSIWATGVVVTPEAYSSLFNFDGSAFSGCQDDHLLPSQRYWFQVQVKDAFDISTWATGFFQLNTPPVVTNAIIVPTVPFHNNDISASYTYADDGNSQSSKTEVRWYQNDVEVISLRNSMVVSSSFLVPQDEWYYTIRPNDGVVFGDLVQSTTATILNRIPLIGNPIILPSSPKASDALNAVFDVFDADGDPVTVNISWFKNGLEQASLKNSKTVPPFLTTVGDSWQFSAIPNDAYDVGLSVQSTKVTIVNSAPVVVSMLVDGATLPLKIKDKNPTFAWTYRDDDFQDQSKYHFAIGTVAAKTSGSSSGMGGLNKSLGIVSIAPNGVLVAGNDVFDSGITQSSAGSLRYATDDSLPVISLVAQDFTSFRNYAADFQTSTVYLKPGSTEGTVSLKFQGATALYDVSLEYEKENQPSTFNLLIDGFSAGAFLSDKGSGVGSNLFKAVRLANGAGISVAGSSDSGGHAKIKSLSLTPIIQLEVQASDFDSFSGYVVDGNGGIKLSGLAGTASYRFVFPSGVYNVELTYVTETTGSPSLSMSVGNTVVSSFSYEVGAKTRIKYLSGISINKGDIIKLMGSQNQGALARVKKIVFRPITTVAVGSKLNPGERYFASVRVFDGLDWSNWYTTTFTMYGSTWSSVSNAVGWTIEAKVAIN